MMEKSLNYAYPRNYAEGGSVDRNKPNPKDRAYLSYEAVDDPTKMRYTLYDSNGNRLQGSVVDRRYIDNLFGPQTVNRGGTVGVQMVAPITDKSNIQVLDEAGRKRIQSGDFDYSYLAQPEQQNPAQDDMVYAGGDPNFDERTGQYISGTAQDDMVYAGGDPNFDERTGQYVDNTTPPVTDQGGFRREGVEFVEYNGQMVPADSVRALRGAVGLEGDRNSAENLAYDVDGDGRLTSADALAFMKYGTQEDYTGNSDFFSNFYGGQQEEDTMLPPLTKPERTPIDKPAPYLPPGTPKTTPPIPTVTEPFTQITPIPPTFTNVAPITLPTAGNVPTYVNPTTPLDNLNLSMGDVAGSFTDQGLGPAAGQELYQSYVLANNPELAQGTGLYQAPDQSLFASVRESDKGIGSLAPTTQNPAGYVLSSGPSTSVFSRRPGG